MSYGKINFSLGLYIEIKLTLVWYNTQIMVLKNVFLQKMVWIRSVTRKWFFIQR